MSNTAIFILVAIIIVGGIFWLVMYSGQRGEKHRQSTSIKTPDSGNQGEAG